MWKCIFDQRISWQAQLAVTGRAGEGALASPAPTLPGLADKRLCASGSAIAVELQRVYKHTKPVHRHKRRGNAVRWHWWQSKKVYPPRVRCRCRATIKGK